MAAAATVMQLLGCGSSSDTTGPSPADQHAATSTAAPTGPPSSPAGSPGPRTALLAVRTADGIAFTDSSGHVRRTVAFSGPQIGSLRSSQFFAAPDAIVAAGRVYFIDDTGTVRHVDASSSPAVDTTFTFIPSRTRPAFAVSGDGANLVYSGLTMPASNPACQDLGCAQPYLPGGAVVVVETATAGGTPATVLRRNLDPMGPDFMQDVPGIDGWDDAGPLVDDAGSASNQGGTGMGDRWWLGHVFLMRADGHHGTAPLGGAGCDAATAAHDGTTVCQDDADAVKGQISVRSASGQILWTPPGATGLVPYAALSPDASSLAMTVQADGVSPATSVTTRGGQSIRLPATFHPEGWLDATTVVGITDDHKGGLLECAIGPLGYVRIDAPGTVVPLHLTGSFIGTIAA